MAFCVGGAFVLGQSIASNSVGTAVAAQPEMDGDQPDMSMMGPTEYHKKMAGMLGEWDVVVQFKMSPSDAEWTESKGTITRKWILDGMFMQEEVNASMGPGMPEFKGIGTMGYNTFTGEYESSWMENTSSPITSATGSYDEATMTWTFIGDMFNPMTGEKVKSKQVYIESDPNRHILESYILMDNGEYWQSFKGVSERRGARSGTR